MLVHFAPVLLVGILGTLFIFGTLVLSFILRPNVPYQEKSMIYDCGEPPVGDAWVNFNIRFYIIALIFLIFEVEVAFMFPVALVYRDWTLGIGMESAKGLYAFVAVLIFAGTLFMGVIYSWRKGDFEWVKKIEPTRSSGPKANVIPENLRPEYFQKGVRSG